MVICVQTSSASALLWIIHLQPMLVSIMGDEISGRFPWDTGVRCNCVRHATLSAPDTLAYAIVSGAMQKPSGGLVHDCTCMCARKRACMHWTYVCSMNIHVLWLQRIPNGRTFPWHSWHALSLQTMANVFHRPRAFNILQGRFCTVADTFAYANVSGRTQLHYAKPFGKQYCICNNVLRIVLHRWNNCMWHWPSFA